MCIICIAFRKKFRIILSYYFFFNIQQLSLLGSSTCVGV